MLCNTHYIAGVVSNQMAHIKSLGLEIPFTSPAQPVWREYLTCHTVNVTHEYRFRGMVLDRVIVVKLVISLSEAIDPLEVAIVMPCSCTLACDGESRGTNPLLWVCYAHSRTASDDDDEHLDSTDDQASPITSL
jgi:hypothetical protein